MHHTENLPTVWRMNEIRNDQSFVTEGTNSFSVVPRRWTEAQERVSCFVDLTKLFPNCGDRCRLVTFQWRYQVIMIKNTKVSNVWNMCRTNFTTLAESKNGEEKNSIITLVPIARKSFDYVRQRKAGNKECECRSSLEPNQISLHSFRARHQCHEDCPLKKTEPLSWHTKASEAKQRKLLEYSDLRV